MIIVVKEREKRMTLDKIKAISPQIIVTGDVDKPYYHICYYDTADNKWHIGYGSYHYSCVREWLSECFIVIKSDVAPVRHAKWELIDECVNEGVYCSNCHKKIYRAEYANQKVKSNYCPNCTTKMYGNEVE